MSEYSKSQKGKNKLCSDGFVYTFAKINTNGNKTWRCEKRSVCRARVHQTPDGTIIRVVREHTHEGQPERKKVLEIVDAIRHRAISTQEITNQVVSIASGGVSQAAKGALPSNAISTQFGCNANRYQIVIYFRQ